MLRHRVNPMRPHHSRLFWLASVTGAAAIAFGIGAGTGCDSPIGATDGAAVDVAAPVIDADGPPPAPSPDGTVVTYAGTGLGLIGVSANGRIQPHGAPTEYYFEYGPTKAYGRRTDLTALGPKIAAHYSESYDKGLAGWRGGSGEDLIFNDAGFVRFEEPSYDDFNHVDGIGILHLVQYLYPGTFDSDAPTAALGGADPDFRDAKIKTVLRGNAWQTSGTELVWWSQVDPKRGVYKAGEELKASNWAHTGYFLTDHLLSGKWETASYRLWNDTTQWTYSGTNRELNAQLKRDLYVYAPLNDVLSHLNTNIFHLLAYIDNYNYPVGSIDFDSIEIGYRNHSLVFPSNGGKLASSPAGSENSAGLTDGWRVGAGKTWKSAPSPSSPQEIVYAFERPVVVQKVQLHQNVDFPSKDVEVLVSNDAGATWTSIGQDAIPASHPAGPNFSYLLMTGLSAPAQKLKIRVLNGYRADAWGLGEVEVFGTGAKMQTEDEENRVNADITGLAPGETVHYRLVAVSGGKTVAGGDQVFAVPSDRTPYAVTGEATRLIAGTAALRARINTLGAETVVFFEYGPDQSYGMTTTETRSGPEISIRTVVANLAGLTPGRTVNYRVVVKGDGGTTRGRNATFVAK